MGVTRRTLRSQQTHSILLLTTNQERNTSGTGNMMVSKAALKFCQNNPVQHQKLQEAIKTAQSGEQAAGGHHHHHHYHQHQAGGEKQRQSWSSRMIFNSKAKTEQNK